MTPAQLERAYDPAVPSDGATLDTPYGPVDLVAVTRALTGQAVPLTRADAAYAISLLPASCGTAVEVAAVGLGVSPDAVQRAVVRRRTRARTAPADRPDTQRTRT
jgi:hypothetical protein